jgi:ribosomal-protein-alanine N-acetyltransferase
MEIITERLLLREITWNDLENIHRLHSIQEVDEHNTLGIPKDIDETRGLIRPDIEAKGKDPQSRYDAGRAKAEGTAHQGSLEGQFSLRHCGG